MAFACVMRKSDKTSRSSSSSSICMIYAFDKGPVTYSLYCFNLSTVAKPLTPPPQPRRHNLLNFYRQYWPYQMGFAASPHHPHLLYAIGGILSGNDSAYDDDDDPILSKKVYTLDLTQIKQQQNQLFIELPEISEMKVGTMNPITVWARRKLYVLTRKWKSFQMRSFEVFDPKSGKWTLLPEFNYANPYSIGTAVIGHTIYFVSHDSVYYFNTKSNCWDRFAQNYWDIAGKFDSSGSALMRTFSRNNIHGAGVVLGGKFYAIGGEDKLLCYDPHCFEIELGAVRGLECLNGADLVHLGDHYFCLVAFPETELSFCDGNKTGGEEGIRFTTFRIVKSQCATRKSFRWADILDSFIITDFVSAPGYVVCSFAFPKISS